MDETVVFTVAVRVSGDVPGPSESPLKDANGDPLRFRSRQAAEAAAVRYCAFMNQPPVREQYYAWVREQRNGKS